MIFKVLQIEVYFICDTFFRKDLLIKMSKVIVIGGGPAGIMAAYFASQAGAEVILIEKNKMLGKKLRITGKGRCNITNACDLEDFISNIYHNGSFMYSSLYSFTNDDLINLFEKNGLKVKIERGKRVFPMSDKAIDVVNTLEKLICNENIEIIFGKKVKSIIIEGKLAKGVMLRDGKKIFSDTVILATGGKSYPLTGSTGDGYDIAKKCGHTITELKPALVGMNTKPIPKSEMVGLLLKNVSIVLYRNGKKVYEDFGELEFRDYGIDGAIVKSASCYMGEDRSDYKIILDLKPALDEKKLDNRIQRDFREMNNKFFRETLRKLLPAKMIDFIIEYSGIEPDKIVHQITKEERKRLLNAIKNMELVIESLRPIDEAIVTSGGVSIKEINPSTMESKIIEGLFFAGELIDVDGYTGGYNLQIAFSTGYIAGINSIKI